MVNALPENLSIQAPSRAEPAANRSRSCGMSPGRSCGTPASFESHLEQADSPKFQPRSGTRPRRDRPDKPDIDAPRPEPAPVNPRAAEPPIRACATGEAESPVVIGDRKHIATPPRGDADPVTCGLDILSSPVLSTLSEAKPPLESPPLESGGGHIPAEANASPESTPPALPVTADPTNGPVVSGAVPAAQGGRLPSTPAQSDGLDAIGTNAELKAGSAPAPLPQAQPQPEKAQAASAEAEAMTSGPAAARATRAHLQTDEALARAEVRPVAANPSQPAQRPGSESLSSEPANDARAPTPEPALPTRDGLATRLGSAESKPAEAAQSASSPAQHTATPPGAMSPPAASAASAEPFQVHLVRGEAAIPVDGLPIEIATRANDGQHRFEIRLDPPELGRISVQLDVDATGKVTSHLLVDRPETLDLLRRDAPALERALQSAGLKTDGGLEFSLRDQAPNRGHEAPPDDRAAKAATAGEADEHVSAGVIRRGYGRLLGLGGGVDIRV